MATISNFNSIIEVSLAINAVLVIFDLLPKMDDEIKSSMRIPPDLWEPDMSKEEERHVATYGWKTYVFTYAILRAWAKSISLFNSLASLSILVFAGFSPNYQISSVTMALVLAWLILPVCIWIIVFYVYFPSLRKRLAMYAKKEYQNLINQTSSQRG